MDTLLGKAVDDMYSYLEQHYNDGSRYVLHYVTAREMYNMVKAAEDGHAGNPNDYRDYILRAPFVLGCGGDGVRRTDERAQAELEQRDDIRSVA